MPKVKVDHNGICMGNVFHKDEIVDLPQEAIDALGVHAKVVSQSAPVQIKRVVKTKQMKRAPYQEVILEGVDRGPQVITKD